MQAAFGTGRNTIEAIYATGRIDCQVFAVDRFSFACMFAISAMRTGFFIEGYVEERVAREKAQQGSDGADRIAKQPSVENGHDNENKQCDDCRNINRSENILFPHITTGRNKLAMIRPKLLYGSKSRHNPLKPKMAVSAVIANST